MPNDMLLAEEKEKKKKKARRAILKSNLTTLTWQVGKKIPFHQRLAVLNMVDLGVAKSVDSTVIHRIQSRGFAKTRPDEEQGADTKAEACHLCWPVVGTEGSYSTEIPFGAGHCLCLIMSLMCGT